MGNVRTGCPVGAAVAFKNRHLYNWYYHAKATTSSKALVRLPAQPPQQNNDTAAIKRVSSTNKTPRTGNVGILHTHTHTHTAQRTKLERDLALSSASTPICIMSPAIIAWFVSGRVHFSTFALPLQNSSTRMHRAWQSSGRTSEKSPKLPSFTARKPRWNESME